MYLLPVNVLGRIQKWGWLISHLDWLTDLFLIIGEYKEYKEIVVVIIAKVRYGHDFCDRTKAIIDILNIWGQVHVC